MIEIDEVFAARMLTVELELKCFSQNWNIRGSAIAFGHPMGYSGSKNKVTMFYILIWEDESLGLDKMPV